STFTVTWGSSTTATSWGGVVILANGGQDMSNVLAQNIQAAVIDPVTGWLTLTGNTTWAGTQAGDYIHVYGARVDTTGADVGIDGAWQVASLSASALVLKPLFDIFARRVSPPIATLSSTNCGGAVVLRTTIRAHDMMFAAWTEVMVMIDGAGTSRADKAAPVNILNTALTVTQALGTIATRWFMTITDGTNSAAIKAASTAAAVVDVGLVVHPSPNMNAPIQVADVASAAITSTATTAAFTPTGGTSYEVNIPVTAVAGTSPTLDVVIEESDDGGTNWFPVYAFQRITATGMYRSPKLPLTGNRVRYVQTITGTGGPSFTRAINRMQAYDSVPVLRQLFDRSINLTSGGSVTPSLNVQGCRGVQLAITIGTAGTPPQIQLEGSDDNGLNWYAIGSPLLAVASSTVQLTAANTQTGLLRGRVSTAGATVQAGHVVMLKGF
ncbi:MAG: hypothetical protein O9333_14160, partial [Beijerinckiaceae bacterium]|nr:hypothetical protein [Beijerinckiaceae bacterium]